MRERPEGFSTVTAIQWLCAAVDRFLGRRDLADVPTLLSGFASVTDHPGASAFARAAFSLRQLGVSFTSENDLRQAVYDFMTWEDARRENQDGYVDQPYEIDPRSRAITFRPRTAWDGRVGTWAEALATGLPLRPHGVAMADPSRTMAVAPGDAAGRRIVVDMGEAGANLPAVPSHDTDVRDRAPVSVPVADLVEIARRFDAIDASRPNRTARFWERRIVDEAGEFKVEILRPKADRSGLEPAPTLDLDGLRHLIGLPGTGKTTLITLLVAWLEKRGLRTVVLLPSIEVAINLMTELDAYGVAAALLMGQSPQTRRSHASRMAERIGSTDEARGFGRTSPFADLVSDNCALAGFDDAHDPASPFDHHSPPCQDLLQGRVRTDGSLADEAPRLCPAASWCGRMKAARGLARHHVWLGHVMSLDTRMPPHFVEEHMRHVEAAARSADVVIADEVDGIQSALDARAVSEIAMTGERTSYESMLVDDLLKPIATGLNYRTGLNVADYAGKATRFMDLNRTLTRLLQNDRAASGQRFLAEYDDAFVTGNRLVADLFARGDRLAMSDEERADQDERLGTVASFWDACVRQALFRIPDTDEGEDRDFDVRRTADALGRSEEDVQDAFRSLVTILVDWISLPSNQQKSEALEAARARLFAFVAPNPDLGMPRTNSLFALLVNVSTVVMQFLSLLPLQHRMLAEGVHRSPMFTEGVSADLARLLPEAVVGRLAGVRFMFQQRGSKSSLVLRYVTFEGAPRVLLYRLHELLRHDGVDRGPNVLLASATSFLADSPSFHVPVSPHYVLRRSSTDDAWRRSRYLVHPIPDPRRPERALRFSGAPYEDRERILRAMVDHFAAGDGAVLPSLLADRFSEGRRVAFVVNGYEQVALVKDQVAKANPRSARRIVGVVREMPERDEGDWTTASRFESLGERDDWDAVVFPMKALSRGVNLVFGGPLHAGTGRENKAAIGTVVFLTRPHPAAESFDFVAGLVGRASMRFDARHFPVASSIGEMTGALRAARRTSLAETRRLLRHSVRVGTLGNLTDAFVSDIMIDVIQTIGRSMRNGCKTRVLFADAAWAPRSSAPGGRSNDDERSSYLVAMRGVLRRLTGSEDAVEREIYEALYRPYLAPLELCAGLRTHSPAFEEELR